MAEGKAEARLGGTARRCKALAGLIALAAGLLVQAPAWADTGKDAPSATFKRIAPPKGDEIAGLDGGIAGYAIRLKAGQRVTWALGLERFRHRLLRDKSGRILRLVVLGPKAAGPPPPRRKPELNGAAFPHGLPGAVPVRLKPGVVPLRLKPGMRPLRWPLDGAVINSGFGPRNHPILGGVRAHRGVDLPAPSGTPVRAAADGVVRARGRNGGYGNYVRLDHGFGMQTAYGHLRRFALGLKRGRRVRRGDVIAYVGSSGLSTGPHLHYEVLIDGRAVDPLRFQPAAPRRIRAP
jgi:hypothetical protein